MASEDNPVAQVFINATGENISRRKRQVCMLKKNQKTHTPPHTHTNKQTPKQTNKQTKQNKNKKETGFIGCCSSAVTMVTI